MQNIPQVHLESVHNVVNLDAVNDAANIALEDINKGSTDIPKKLDEVRQLHKDRQQAIGNITRAENECKDQ